MVVGIFYSLSLVEGLEEKYSPAARRSRLQVCVKTCSSSPSFYSTWGFLA
ncbi:hypothetical protein RchiOBHm_Chr0c38g0503101 [Rosa chinensis]|uniref:Uncharacterized protein n=1 Tax=Rosa chinensis TaxID=74649 RepID=A0A2P6SQ52_ROSCH|nr:hypothetical protein RchiOBHm_Chr0c38g0503101 [Rosa chinensis]